MIRRPGTIRYRIQLTYPTEEAASRVYAKFCRIQHFDYDATTEVAIDFHVAQLGGRVRLEFYVCPADLPLITQREDVDDFLARSIGGLAENPIDCDEDVYNMRHYESFPKKRLAFLAHPVPRVEQ